MRRRAGTATKVLNHNFDQATAVTASATSSATAVMNSAASTSGHQFSTRLHHWKLIHGLVFWRLSTFSLTQKEVSCGQRASTCWACRSRIGAAKNRRWALAADPADNAGTDFEMSRQFFGHATVCQKFQRDHSLESGRAASITMARFGDSLSEIMVRIPNYWSLRGLVSNWLLRNFGLWRRFCRGFHNRLLIGGVLD